MPLDPATEPSHISASRPPAEGERHEQPTANPDPADKYSMPRTTEESGRSPTTATLFEPRRRNPQPEPEPEPEPRNETINVTFEPGEVIDKLGSLSVIGGLF